MPAQVGDTDIYTVDTRAFGIPETTAMYVIDAPRPALVDTGTAATTGAVSDALDALDIDPVDVEHILVTHVHLDHAGGAGELARVCENARVYVHERGIGYLTDEERLAALRESVARVTGDAEAHGDPELLARDRCLAVTGGERVDLGDRALELIDAPGHAPHHFCAHDPATGALFSIDAAGMYLEGRLRPTTPPPAFDLAASLRTVECLRSREPTVNLYGHFGPGEDAAAELREYERLLPEWVATVDRLRGDHDDVDAIVAALDARWHSITVRRDVAGVLAYLDRTERAEVDRLLG